jgi:hypothetical protein
VRLLIIECGNSKLPTAISLAAQALKPKPEMVSVMNLHMEKLNIPEFKHMLYHLAPDSIILNPPAEPISGQVWSDLVREVLRHSEVMSGKVLLISSFEVLGDSYQRNEDAVEMPVSDYGVFLQCVETQFETSPTHFIMRLPYFEVPKDPQYFTLISLEDAAKALLDKLETGRYGKYHVTPNDKLFHDELETNLVAKEAFGFRIPERSLYSKYNWEVKSSKETFSRLGRE